MKKSLTFLLFLLFCLSLVENPLPAQKTAGNDTRVAKIDVVVRRIGPNEFIDPNAVKSRLKTKEGALFTQGDFDEDLKTLSIEFDRVEPRLQFINNQVFITLDIWAKPTIREILYQGNEAIKQSALQDELGVTPKTTFDRHTFNEAFQKLKAYYVKKGFFEAQLDYTISPIPDTNQVDITINIHEGRAGRIKNIYFEGFTKAEERHIVELIQTKKYNFFTSWITTAGTYNQEALEQDQLIIANYIQNEGYADAKVTLEVKDAEEPNRINIFITLERCEQYCTGSVTFSGNKIFTDEQIQSRLLLKPGGTFSPEKLRETARCLTDLYGACGYIEANINYQPHLVPNQCAYDVHFTIEEGEQYRVGLIKVFGNCYTQSSVILHECLLIPGDIFNLKKLQATEERLKNIQYFKNVNVYPVKSTEDKVLGACYRNVHIEVEEDSTGNLSAFFGFSTLDNLFGGVELFERNFNYKGIGRLGKEGPQALRGAGEYLQLRAMFGTKSGSYLLRWVKPYFRDTNWILGFDLEKTDNKLITKDYNIQTWGFKLHATYPINAFLRFGWNYRIRWSDAIIHNINNSTTENQAKSGGWISSSGVNLLYSRLDNAHAPRDGFRSELSMEYVGLGGRFHYLNTGYDNTLYVPMGCKGVLKFRGDIHYIQTFGNTTPDNLPLSERFFMGGDTTVRGYRGFSIGPKYPNGDPKGGISSILLSEEYMHHLFNRVDGFVFLDGGSVSDREHTMGTLRFSYGAGLRVDLFNNIPIVFGMGFPINPADKSDTKRFFFSLGGRF